MIFHKTMPIYIWHPDFEKDVYDYIAYNNLDAKDIYKRWGISKATFFRRVEEARKELKSA